MNDIYDMVVVELIVFNLSFNVQSEFSGNSISFRIYSEALKIRLC